MKWKLVYSIIWLVPFALLAQVSVGVVGTLPTDVSETSGLIFYKNTLITHNDSGNTPELFELDTVSLQLSRRITIDNAENIDWEDITQDAQYIYVGDFGNNRGTRQDLKIYRISKADYDQSENVVAEIIAFNYEDQTDFTDNGSSDWDAEALIVLNDQLVVLTKQWQSNGTKAYLVPKSPGTHEARLIGNFAVGGLITGAAYDPDDQTIYVLGHTTILKPFLYKVEGATETSFFGGTVERIELDIDLGQLEGIGYVAQNKYMLSSENFSPGGLPISLEAQLFSVSFLENGNEEEEEEEEPNEEVDPDPENPDDKLVLYNNLGTNILEYDLVTDKPIFAQAIFDVSGKMVLFNSGSDIESNTIDLNTFESAIYFLHLYLGDTIVSKSFVRQ